MTRSRFVLFLAPLVLAPIPLGARSQGELGQLAPAPVLGAARTIDGLTVSTSLRVEGKRLRVTVTSENPSKGPLSRTLRVSVLERPEANPMARMAPMPRIVGGETLTVVLAPGQRLEKELVLTTTATIRRPDRLLVGVYADGAGRGAAAQRPQRGNRWRVAQNAGL